MMTVDFFQTGTRMLVVGAGSSGLAALRLAAQKGCELALSDGGPQTALAEKERQWLSEQGVETEFGGHTSATFLAAQVIIVSPGVPLDLPELVAARKRDIPIIGELEFASLFLTRPVVAVTGTNGKTTVTTLIGHILREAGHDVFVGGNIGTPLSDFVARGQDADVAVLEVSSFQLDGCQSFHPHIALLLNISPDHLDRYASFHAYGDSKMSMFARQDKNDWAIINGDDGEISKRRAVIGARLLTFSALADGAGEELVVEFQGNRECYLLPEALRGQPNRANSQAAILAARAFGCPVTAIGAGLARYQPLAHRLVTVARLAGVRYVDDSKATNIGAVVSALQGQQSPVILIAGGRDKGGDYQLLLPQLRRIVRLLILLGEAAPLMAEKLAAEVETVRVADMEEAVRLAAAQARAGETVLLSPACASFDMFRSYQERGHVFQQAVMALSGGHGKAVETEGLVGEAA